VKKSTLAKFLQQLNAKAHCIDTTLRNFTFNFEISYHKKADYMATHW